MKETLFEIFGYSIHTYSVMLALGVILIAVCYNYRLKKLDISDADNNRLFVVGAVAGLFTYLGASLFDSLWHCISKAMVNGVFVPSNFHFTFDAGGITFEGGIIVGVTAYLILCALAMKKNKQHPLFFMDQLIAGILIAHCLGRIGCFFAGCCYGKPTDSIFGMMYPTDDGWMKVYPTQLYEAFFLFVCFIIFFFFIKKDLTEKYFITYGVFRFFLEYLRGDDRGNFIIPFLSPSQFMSIVMIIMGIIFIIMRKTHYKKELNEYEKNKEEYQPKLEYYSCSYKGLFKGLLNKKMCPKCGKKLHVGFHKEIYLANRIENIKVEHPTYICKDCHDEYDI